MGEFAGKNEAIENTCRQFKQWELGVLTELCRVRGAELPEQLGYKLFVLLEGVSAIVQVSKGGASPVDMLAMVDGHHRYAFVRSLSDGITASRQ